MDDFRSLPVLDAINLNLISVFVVAIRSSSSAAIVVFFSPETLFSSGFTLLTMLSTNIMIHVAQNSSRLLNRNTMAPLLKALSLLCDHSFANTSFGLVYII